MDNETELAIAGILTEIHDIWKSIIKISASLGCITSKIGMSSEEINTMESLGERVAKLCDANRKAKWN